MYFDSVIKRTLTLSKVLTVTDDEHIPNARTYFKFNLSPTAPLINNP